MDNVEGDKLSDNYIKLNNPSAPTSVARMFVTERLHQMSKV